jgi:hypothetical protein
LGETSVSVKGLGVLAKFEKLEKLSFWKADKIDDDAIGMIAERKSLRWVDLKDTKVTEAGAARLRAAIPGCEVVR